MSATEHFDEAFLLLEQLGEDELNDLNEEFDPEVCLQYSILRRLKIKQYLLIFEHLNVVTLQNYFEDLTL